MVALLRKTGRQLGLRTDYWHSFFIRFFRLMPEQQAAGKAVELAMSTQFDLHAQLLSDYGRVPAHGGDALDTSISKFLVRAWFYCQACCVPRWCGLSIENRLMCDFYGTGVWSSSILFSMGCVALITGQHGPVPRRELGLGGSPGNGIVFANANLYQGFDASRPRGTSARG